MAEYLSGPEPVPAEQKQEAPAPEVPAEPVETPEETPPVPDKAPAKNWRITAKNDVEARVMEMYRRNPDMSLAEAMERVNGKAAPKPAAETPPPAAAPADTVPTVASLEAKKTDLIAKIKQASSVDLDFEKAAELQAELAELPFQLMEAKQREQTVKAEQQSATQQAITAAEQKAVELYPDINVEGSEIRAEMEAISAELEANEDPLLTQPDCGLRIAQMAATRLNLAPATVKRKETTPPAGMKAPEQPAPTVKPRPMPGAGASQQTGVPQIDLKKLSMDELMVLADQVGAGGS